MGEWAVFGGALATCLKEFAEVSSYLWEKGWAESNAGNLSVDVTGLLRDAAPRVPDPSPAGPVRRLDQRYPALAGRTYLVTGSGRRFRDVARDVAHNTCLLEMTPEGNAFRMIRGGEEDARFRPTSEFPSHLRSHEFLQQSNAPETVVLHTHPTELIAVTHIPEFENEAVLNRALWSIHPEVKVAIPRGLGLVPYVTPGTEDLAAATVEAFRRRHSVVAWQWHGCVAIARDVLSAFDLVDTANKAAQLILACRSAGIVPRGLTDDQLRELARTFGLEE